jgi:hypothetical protein
VSSIADVSLNAQDLGVTLDASKSRNVITVQFPDTSISTNPVPILSISQAITLPRGSTILTFALDSLAVEIHGSGTGAARPLWTLTNLTATQISTPNPPVNVHYVSFNTAVDGSGSVLPAVQVYARILTADAASITIQFFNNSGNIAYVANNGQEVPFMQILGYAITSNDGYVTQRDVGSVAARRERGLSSELDWIQDRNTANTIAELMVTLLAKPRGQVNVTVFGDPRRRPGQLVTIIDSEGTRAAGTWRILSIDHNISGAQYTQDLSLVQVGTVLNWDDPTTTWDNSVWGP